ncbi:MAG: hypothetical protein GW917_00040, partial [Bdellovibrionales bacterium]|nr:hypothetical protein [Bdellovibrionales bacterium]
MKFFLLSFSSIVFFLQLNSAHAELVDKVVAVVNSEVLTLSDVQREKKSIKGKGLVNDLLFQIYDRE